MNSALSLEQDLLLSAGFMAFPGQLPAPPPVPTAGMRLSPAALPLLDVFAGESDLPASVGSDLCLFGSVPPTPIQPSTGPAPPRVGVAPSALCCELLGPVVPVLLPPLRIAGQSPRNAAPLSQFPFMGVGYPPSFSPPSSALGSAPASGRASTPLLPPLPPCLQLPPAALEDMPPPAFVLPHPAKRKRSADSVPSTSPTFVDRGRVPSTSPPLEEPKPAPGPHSPPASRRGPLLEFGRLEGPSMLPALARSPPRPGPPAPPPAWAQLIAHGAPPSPAAEGPPPAKRRPPEKPPPERKEKAGSAKPRLDFARLAEHFDKSSTEAADLLGISTTRLKRVSRAAGVVRWPFRKVSALDRWVTIVRSVAVLHAGGRIQSFVSSGFEEAELLAAIADARQRLLLEPGYNVTCLIKRLGKVVVERAARREQVSNIAWTRAILEQAAEFAGAQGDAAFVAAVQKALSEGDGDGDGDE